MTALPGFRAPARTSARLTASAVVAALAWLVFSIGLRPLSLPEEGRYVGVAWEMLRSGHWLVPTEDGLPFFHKPPLFYWLTAASMQVFGTSEAAARFAPLLGALVGAAALYFACRRWAGEQLARWTLLVLLTVPFFFGGAQFANLDMLVAGFMALTVLAAADAVLRARSGQPWQAAIVTAWAAAALGVLAKGLIGVVLPGLVVLVWLIATGQSRRILALLSPLGLAAFAVIVTPWFVAVQSQYPGFARFFFIYQHFERFAAGGFNNAQPWWFFLVALPLLTLPWSIWLLRSSFRARTGETREATLWRQLMWIWLGVVVLFFSIPQSKPVGYVMAVVFPLAALVAEAVAHQARIRGGAAVRLALTSAGVAIVICVTAIAYFSLAYDRDNTALARTLLRSRAPGDPVVFVDEYFFDVPLHAHLTDPVPVISNWHDPAIARRDNWKRELSEAAPFAPDIAGRVLVDAEHGFALRCGAAPLWVVAKSDNESSVAAIPGARRVDMSNRVALWRLPAGGCTAPSTAPSRP